MRLLTIDHQDVRIDGRFIRVARLVAEQYEEIRDPAATIDALGHLRTGADLFTFVQMLPDTQRLYPYSMEWDNLAALPVSTFDGWWKNQISGKARNKLRRAEKNCVIVKEVPFDEELLRGIKAVYDESPVRQGKAFWHYGESLETIRRQNSSFLDRSVFIGGYADGALIGFAKLVWNERSTQAGLMQIVSMIGQRDKAPSNALIAGAVKACAARGIPYLFYSRFSFGKRQRDSLSDFKEASGFRRIDLPRYYVPLTTTGRVALRLHVHRDAAIDYLPEPLQAVLRSARESWTARRLRPNRLV